MARFILFAFVLAGIFASRYCGKKIFLVIPSIAVPLAVGIVGDMILWDTAHGRYQDSDTIIFGLPRMAHSADGWYLPVSTVLTAVLALVSVSGIVYAARPLSKSTAVAKK